MKIDIHAHTKKCKSGDALTREVSAAVFCETLLSTEVRIIAITNHNTFDLDQYLEITAILGSDAQVWPGIELDIMENDSKRGHLLVIVSPTKAEEFSSAVKIITNDYTPDTFTTTIEQVLGTFDLFSPVYVAHYKQKKPDLSDEAIEELMTETGNSSCVIKEVTNSISAGIYISHGHASIYGSDVSDWSKYEKLSRDLPDLRLPVDSFEHFCLLLAKDSTTINTALDKKTSESLVLQPFDDDSQLTIRAYNDINVIFGPKGTGKSCILKAIAKYYAEHGIDAKVYVSASDRLDVIFDTKGKDLSIDLKDYEIEYCTNNIASLRDAKEVDVTSLTKYEAHFSAENTNRNAGRILLKNIDPEEQSSANREFTEFKEAVKTTGKFLEFLAMSPPITTELSEEEYFQVQDILSKLLQRLKSREWHTFSGWKEIALLNSAISTFRTEVERKTGSPAKPTTTGFRGYAMNRIRIEIDASEILKSVESALPIDKQRVGSLGASKGELEFWTELKFQDGNITDALSSPRILVQFL